MSKFYRFVETDWGFKVIPDSDTLDPVWAVVDRYGYIHVTRESKLFDDRDDETDPYARMWAHETEYGPYGLFERHGLLSAVVDLLYRKWTPRKIRGKQYNDAPGWQKARTRKSLGKQYKAQLDWLCSRMDPDVVEAHRKNFALNGGQRMGYDLAPIIENMQNNPYILKDYLNLYAVRAAFGMVGPSTAKDMIEDWTTFYTEHGDNVFIRKTIASTNGFGLPYWITARLRYIAPYLKETIRTRTRMLAYYMARETMGYDGNRLQAVCDSLLRSSDEDIKRAVEIASQDAGYTIKIDWRKRNDIENLLSWIFDVCREMPYRQIARCKITGLAKRSEAYHQELRRQNEERRLEEEKRNAILYAAKTAQPPVKLEAKGIKVLDTYKAIRDEGSDMGHCVGGYASGAVQGHYYILHIDHNDEKATAQVNHDGRLVQIHGPHNKHNAACDYATPILQQWGQLLQGTEPIIHADMFALQNEQRRANGEFYEDNEIPF